MNFKLYFFKDEDDLGLQPEVTGNGETYAFASTEITTTSSSTSQADSTNGPKFAF